VDNRSEVRQFLVTRRAKITPQQAGVPAYGGGQRRVPGLRRAEVALLAGVSVEYYSRLERGNLKGVSDSVLDAIARALQLDDAEHAHLIDLARSANATPTTRRRTRQQLRPALQHMLDAMTDAPAFIRNGRLDVLAANRLGHALYAPVFTNPAIRANLARFRFLDPAAADFFPDGQESANTTVALLRTEAGRDPYNRALTDLVGELSTRSDEFRTLWAAHDVRLHHTGIKHFHHPVVGDVTFSFEAMPLPSDPGLTLTALSAEPGSPTQDALKLLASWTTTLHQTETPRAAKPV
jgi:transcriptional regulator with XRE-family HTH domain